MSFQPSETEFCDDTRAVLQVVTTVASEADARRLARELVERRVAACVQIESAIRSVYRWQDQVCEEPEYRLLAKTTAARYPALQKCLQEIHPYDLPEIVATSIVCGSTAYLQWVADEVEAAQS